MRLKTVLASLLLTPVVAFAQATTSSVEVTFTGTGTTQNQRNLRADACGQTVNMTVTLPSTVQACSSFRVWLTTASSCENTPPSGAKVLYEQEPQSFVFLRPNDTFDIVVSDLPLFTEGADGGTTDCASSQVEESWLVCGAFNTSFGQCGLGETTVKDLTPPTLRFDSLPPATPTVGTVTPLKKSLRIDFTVGEDTSSVIGRARLQGSDAVVADDEVLVSQNDSVTIDGLENNVTYDVELVAVDSAGNESAPSAAVSGTPVEVCGFYCQVVEDGGPKDVGCSAAGGATLGISALVIGVFGLARRRRTWR